MEDPRAPGAPSGPDPGTVYCAACGEKNLRSEPNCRRCGQGLAGPASTPALVLTDEGSALRMLLPIGRWSGWAVASGYLGLLSLLLVPAPFAILTGVLAVRELRRNPGRHGMGRAIFGITMGVLGTLALIFFTTIGRLS
jgi:hypothetical protein